MTADRFRDPSSGNRHRARREAVEVGESPSVKGERGLLATKTFARGEVILVIEGPTTSVRTRYTVQVSPTEHLEPKQPDGTPSPGHFLNHSCDPNTGVRIVKNESATHVEVVARREIGPREELTLDYAAMEYDTAASEIKCQCGSARCRGKLKGYKDLPHPIRAQYKAEGLIPDFLSGLS